MSRAPRAVVIAGPNGARKSSAAPAVLRDFARVATYVNADVIAEGLSAFRPEDAAVEAGRVMLLYRELVDGWRLYDASELAARPLVAEGIDGRMTVVLPAVWGRIASAIPTAPSSAEDI